MQSNNVDEKHLTGALHSGCEIVDNHELRQNRLTKLPIQANHVEQFFPSSSCQSGHLLVGAVCPTAARNVLKLKGFHSNY